MRSLMIATALLAVGACSRGGTANNSTTTTNTTNSAAVAPAKAEKAASNAAAAATPEEVELAAIEQSNAESATATAVALPKETDADSRAATCIVFLGISRDRNSRAVGYDDAAMAQAQDQWKSDLAQRFSQAEADQLTGSSVNMLMPAAAAQRDAASRWCVQNAPEIGPEG